MKKNGVTKKLFSKTDNNTRFDGHNYVGRYSNVCGTKMGFGSYVGDKSVINNSLIGKYCSIGSNVSIINGKHPVRDFVSTHPAFYSPLNASQLKYVNEKRFEEFDFADDKGNQIIIENDVWIGTDVRIQAGVTIHSGAVIAAGSLVTKDVEPYAIVGGVPAKLIRKRFDDNTVSALLSLNWWDKDEEWIKKHALLFDNCSKFLESID